jgi:hypothetical protein
VTEDVASQEDWRAIFTSVIEGAVSQEDWIASMLENPIWDTKILPHDGGWNEFLSKREC